MLIIPGTAGTIMLISMFTVFMILRGGNDNDA